VAWRSQNLVLQHQCHQLVTAVTTEAEHKEAELTGLIPNTPYFYSVGGASAAPAGQALNTAPVKGELPADGTPKYPGQAQAVLDGFPAYNGANDAEAVDLFLLLGDNAYPEGSDEQWQIATFDLYKPILTQAATWPTIGNHEMGSRSVSTCSDPNSFTLSTLMMANTNWLWTTFKPPKPRARLAKQH